MQSLPTPLVGAVQDLHDLYTRLSPRGPYRLSLFADQPEADAAWPAQVQRRVGRLDTLIRGVGCLLANDLAAAAIPLTAALWQAVRDLERSLAGAGWREPAYYRYLGSELRKPPATTPATAYRLFGEVLAVYLDILCDLRAGWKEEYQPAISRLRRELAQTGDVSSGSAAAESPSPAGGVEDSA